MKVKMKWTVIAALMIVAVMALSACGNNNKDNNSTTNTNTPSNNSASSNDSSTNAAGGETKEITIDASNWKFDQTEIKANKGDTIKLTLKNSQGVHGISIEDLGVDIKGGETKEFTVNDAGTFEFHCSVQCGQGHNDMSGKIIVE
ncbi:cupredoxin domain-containing protein [Paenibacillus nasutitermitis]|uniref:EfeO-type cupredoxin-like domain-containing protein n=1 Tax=Paenibacillus nasutitermitis TaxID=1652958 RepID=A0A917E175_9BACL|nr:cupredoxin domain-containing protein [Paenibacillus nasutitermitis]GGD90970.1 hypothetical protein GCM10010911_57090 [Paenibacillus nasutitermitis]